MNNYNEVCQLCNKIEFAVFKINNLTGSKIKNLTEKYSNLGSEEEITKSEAIM